MTKGTPALLIVDYNLSRVADVPWRMSSTWLPTLDVDMA
jgi:hypothetical protein